MLDGGAEANGASTATRLDIGDERLRRLCRERHAGLLDHTQAEVSDVVPVQPAPQSRTQLLALPGEGGPDWCDGIPRHALRAKLPECRQRHVQLANGAKRASHTTGRLQKHPTFLAWSNHRQRLA